MESFRPPSDCPCIHVSRTENERRCSGERMFTDRKESCASCPNVDENPVVLVAEGHLGCSIRRGPASGLERLACTCERWVSRVWQQIMASAKRVRLCLRLELTALPSSRVGGSALVSQQDPRENRQIIVRNRHFIIGVHTHPSSCRY